MVKTIARKHGFVCTFMPKFDKNLTGSGVCPCVERAGGPQT